MSRPTHRASMKDFARSGHLGPLALGVPRVQVRNELGPPTDWLNRKPVNRSGIWKYGDVEVHFDANEQTCLLHFDSFQVPTAGPTLDLDPWILRRGLPLADLEAALRAEQINCSSEPHGFDPELVHVRTAVGVYFLVAAYGDADKLGLLAFGCERAKS